MFMKHSTVWKFQDFSTSQILREISFREFRRSKTAILTFLETLKFDVWWILAFFPGPENQFQSKSKFRATKFAENGYFWDPEMTSHDDT